MTPRNTKERPKVAAVSAWSEAQALLGALSMVRNWDAASPWYNSKYTDEVSGAQWVFYEADHAWPGEVRIIQEPHGT